MKELFDFPKPLPKPRKPRRSHLQKFCEDHAKTILELNDGKPDLMCYAVSASLQGVLGFCEHIKCKMVEGEVEGCSHWWLEMPDGRIIDGTASQFNAKHMPLVYIGPLPEWYSRISIDARASGA